jgi:hypothetical protein
MGDKPPVPRVSAFLLAGLVLLFLAIVVASLVARIPPAVFGAAAALGLLALIVWLIPANLGGGGKPRRPESHYRRHWILRGPSPLRQELTFSGTRQCTISFWFMGNQPLEFRYDPIDSAGDDIPQLTAVPRGPVHGGRPCWAQDEHGPAGHVFMPEKPEGWSFTLRYALRAPEERVVRGADLRIEVEPQDARVTIPDEPKPLPEPAIAWGRLDTPSEHLTRAPGHG